MLAGRPCPKCRGSMFPFEDPEAPGAPYDLKCVQCGRIMYSREPILAYEIVRRPGFFDRLTPTTSWQAYPCQLQGCDGVVYRPPSHPQKFHTLACYKQARALGLCPRGGNHYKLTGR